MKNQSYASFNPASKGLQMRVKTPNEASLLVTKMANQNSGSGNRANLFNKYLRSSDISNQKRVSGQRIQSSRSKRNVESVGYKSKMKR